MKFYSYYKVLQEHKRIIEQAPDLTAKHFLAEHEPEIPRPWSPHYSPECERELCNTNNDWYMERNKWPCPTYLEICELHEIAPPKIKEIEAAENNMPEYDLEKVVQEHQEIVKTGEPICGDQQCEKVNMCGITTRETWSCPRYLHNRQKHNITVPSREELEDDD